MTAQFIVNELINHVLNEIDRDPSAAPRFERRNDAREIWKSLLFCVLSSQVRVSSASHAVTELLAGVRFFERNLSSVDVYRQAKEILSREDVRYRFPETRARQVANSWFAFAQVKDDFYEYLDSFGSEREARAAISQSLPGLGLKQASMFLRDIGYAGQLCVIDTHILWYARARFLWSGNLTPKAYLELEELLLAQSEYYGVAPNILDSAIWVAVKTYKSKQCTMRFA